MKPSIALVAGTRPEVVKLAPVLRALRQLDMACKLIAIGQQPDLVKRHLMEFGIDSDEFGIDPDLPITTWQDKRLGPSLGHALNACEQAFEKDVPSVVVVQGDTLTALAGTWAAYSRQIPVAHVEAGLRSGSHDSPFPEEGIRKVIGQLATWHFAPTEAARENLQYEGVRDNVFVTGNTIVDALSESMTHPLGVVVDEAMQQRFREEIDGRDVVVVTCHRREGWATYLPKICEVVKRLSPERYLVVWPRHPNPNVEAVFRKAMAKRKRTWMVKALDHGAFLEWLYHAKLVITDSGGVIEEATHMGIPTMIMREHTERQEAVGAGTAVLVPSWLPVNEMVTIAKRLCGWQRRESRAFGDGNAGERIARILAGAAMVRP